MNKRFTRRGFLGFLVGATALSLAACSRTSSQNSSEAKSAANASSSSEAPDYHRIVALNSGQLDTLLLLGITPVGVASAKDADLIPQFIRDRFEAEYDLNSIVNCGSRIEPDLETVASLEPTLILANTRSDETLLEKLRTIAPVATSVGGADNWKRAFNDIAEVVDKRNEAQQLLDDYESSATEIRDSLPTPPPVISFLRGNGSGIQTYGLPSMVGSVSADCGFARPASQQFTDKAAKDLSPELIAEADGEWLFYAVQSGGESPVKAALWPTLDAVKNGRTVEVDYDSWYVNASLVSAQIILDGLKSHILEAAPTA